MPEMIEELRQAAMEAWDAVTIEKINAQVRSMEDRVAAVIFTEGGNTGY